MKSRYTPKKTTWFKDTWDIIEENIEHTKEHQTIQLYLTYLQYLCHLVPVPFGWQCQVGNVTAIHNARFSNFWRSPWSFAHWFSVNMRCWQSFKTNLALLLAICTLISPWKITIDYISNRNRKGAVQSVQSLWLRNNTVAIPSRNVEDWRGTVGVSGLMHIDMDISFWFAVPSEIL